MRRDPSPIAGKTLVLDHGVLQKLHDPIHSVGEVAEHRHLAPVPFVGVVDAFVPGHRFACVRECPRRRLESLEQAAAQKTRTSHLIRLRIITTQFIAGWDAACQGRHGGVSFGVGVRVDRCREAVEEAGQHTVHVVGDSAHPRRREHDLLRGAIDMHGVVCVVLLDERPRASDRHRVEHIEEMLRRQVVGVETHRCGEVVSQETRVIGRLC